METFIKIKSDENNSYALINIKRYHNKKQFFQKFLGPRLEFNKKYPLLRDFLHLAAKLKDTCVSNIETITFNKDGSISIQRNVPELENNGRVLRNRYRNYKIISTYDDIDSYCLIPENNYFDQVKLEEPEIKLKQKNLEIQKLRLDLIFNEIGQEKTLEKK
ncbi:45569_t:CDS:2 [Gigaspora margarita]|uniref:45569_t:CDS:1 n=1 Tax=Gigaspora margarita TaxID=4874 RepID=A0ABM8VZ85_GIGMA|nr:45569_t:CDS:2 [Gigaspora margarita]